jgi:hypothetical protein
MTLFMWPLYIGLLVGLTWFAVLALIAPAVIMLERLRRLSRKELMEDNDV